MTTTDMITYTKLTAEEIKALGALLDRASTKGYREARTLLHLATKLQQMLTEAPNEVTVDEK